MKAAADTGGLEKAAADFASRFKTLDAQVERIRRELALTDKRLAMADKSQSHAQMDHAKPEYKMTLAPFSHRPADRHAKAGVDEEWIVL